MLKTKTRFPIYPDPGAILSVWARQTEIAYEMNAQMMRIALAPWQSWLEYSSPMARRRAAARPSSSPKPSKAPAPVAVKDVPRAVAQQVTAPVDAAVKTVEAVLEAPKKAADAEIAPVSAANAEKQAAQIAKSDGPARPPRLKAPRGGKPDDLTALKGVGPKLVEALSDLGIYHFDQIAQWNEAEVAWIDANLGGIRGGASRNGWVAQAKTSLKG